MKKLSKGIRYNLYRRQLLEFKKLRRIRDLASRVLKYTALPLTRPEVRELVDLLNETEPDHLGGMYE